MLLMILAAVFLCGFLAYARFVEPYRLTETRMAVSHTNAPDGFSEITIAVFSDTHFSSYYNLRHFEKMKDRINAEKPDIILFCGDLIDDYRTYGGNTVAIADSLAGLNANIGKFAVYGNHDHGGGAKRVFAEIMETAGFVVLLNDAFELPDLNMMIVGLDDFIFGEASVDAAGLAREDYFNIVLCHEPDVANMLTAYDIDLMVAGHTHGGQINLPGYEHVFFPPFGQIYTQGFYILDSDRSTSLYVSPGIGTTKMPLRFRATPEVAFITVINN